MEIREINLKNENLTCFLKGNDSGEDFCKIDRLLRDIVGIKRIKKTKTPFCLINKYRFRNGEVLLVTDDELGTYLTVEKKENEKVLESIIKVIKDIPNLDKYEPFPQRILRWMKNMRLISKLSTLLSKKAFKNTPTIENNTKNETTEKPNPYNPESEFIIETNDEIVSCKNPDGTVESILWPELKAVIIETNDGGPFVPDAFFLLIGEQSGCVIPLGATGEEKLLDKLLSLPGYNYKEHITAMASTENARFLCWKDETQV